MILIADSGSTKTDWIAIRNAHTAGEFHTKGFNPFFHDQSFIVSELQSCDGLKAISHNISAIFYFGAGCSSDERRNRIFSALTAFFPNALIQVEHDMLGTALSVCEGKPGLAAILGTGSNICFFDGINISETRHGIGYVLGDEASGSYFGKKLLAAHLYQLLPPYLEKMFNEQYGFSKDEILQRIYQQPGANVFLASFAPFLSVHSSDPFIEKMVHHGISEFFDTNVLSYPQSASFPVHFTGTIAHIFRDTIRKVAGEKNVVVGNIIQKPITGLVRYFSEGGRMPA